MKTKMLCCQKFNTMVIATTFALSMATILGLSDSFLAGIFLGEQGIAAVSTVSAVVLLGTFLSGLISIGPGFVYAKAIGQFDKTRANRVFSMSLYFSVLLGILMGVLSYLFKDLYFDTLGTSPEIRMEAEKYFFWITVANIFYPLRMVLSEFVTAEGDEINTSLSYVIQIVGNLILSVYLCSRIGIAGIGIGTLVGTILSILVNCGHFFRKENNLQFRFGFDKEDLKEMLLFSIADSFLYLFLAVTDFVLNYMVILRFGERYLPVLSLGMFVVQFTISFDGIGTAFSPIINVYLGEKNYRICEQFMRHVIRVALVEGAIVLLFFASCAPLVVKLFAIEDPLIYPSCIVAVRITAFVMPAAAILITMLSLYNITGHIWITTLIECFEQTILPIAFATVGGILFGINGLWVGYVAAFFVTIVGGYLILVKLWGKEKSPWFLPDDEDFMKTFHMELDQDKIMNMNSEIQELLEEHQVNRRSSIRLQLFVEELGMLLLEKNEHKKILLEWTISIGEKVHLIVRYGGDKLDLTQGMEEDAEPIRAMVLAKLMEAQEDKRYLMSTGLNRCSFTFNR